MMIKTLLISLIYSALTWADNQPKSLAGFDPETDIISEDYEAGPFLIYDCKSKHWVCVMEPFFKKCQEDRASSPKDRPACAPIGTLPTKKSCFQRQLFLTTQNHGERFCKN